jgi:hypothetical protein
MVSLPCVPSQYKEVAQVTSAEIIKAVTDAGYQATEEVAAGATADQDREKKQKHIAETTSFSVAKLTIAC